MKKWRWKILGLALLALAVSPWLFPDSRLGALRHIGGLSSLSGYDSDFSDLPAVLPPPTATLVSIYAGLPHPNQDIKRYTTELASARNIAIHGHRFYADPIKAPDALRLLLPEVLTNPATYEAYAGPKLCGGYHPDFAVELEADGKRHEFLVCLGCGEILIYANGKELHCDLQKDAFHRLARAWNDRDPFKAAVRPRRLPIERDVLTAWGYKETGSGTRPQRDWEKERFGRAAIRHQAIKSLAEVPDMPRTYFRFTIVEERYQTAAEAERRATDLTFTPAGLDSKMEPGLILRKGFAKDSKVYFIETDAIRFDMEIPAVLARLNEHCETTLPRDVFGEIPE